MIILLARVALTVGVPIGMVTGAVLAENHFQRATLLFMQWGTIQRLAAA